jgi:hypothetical protein
MKGLVMRTSTSCASSFRSRSTAGAAAGLIVLLSAPLPRVAAQTTVPGPAGAFAALSGAFKQEAIEIKLAPKEGMEYKYRIPKGGVLLYSWSSTAQLHYELHSEPEGSPRGYAESFDKHDARNEAHGIFTAPYPGIHGWYWENRSPTEVTIKLTSAGSYVESLEFRRAGVTNKKFE